MGRVGYGGKGRQGRTKDFFQKVTRVERHFFLSQNKRVLPIFLIWGIKGILVQDRPL